MNNYQKSNSILKVNFKLSNEDKILAKDLLAVTDHRERNTLGEQLLGSLSTVAKISPVKLKVSDTRQWHKKRGGRVVFKLHGYYRPKSAYIYIQNLTSIRGRPLAPKTFLNTLLHEWLHHYDTEKLKLQSIHTKGFYLRLSSLKVNLNL